jgi:DNA-binding Lrp family transcriptional regulator
MSIKVTYPINYSGYVPLLRRVLLLLKENIISISELGIYIYFVMQADFDKKHSKYRVILRDDQQIANELGISSSTIYRHRKKLIKAGLLQEDGCYTKVTNYRIFELETVKRIAKTPYIKPEKLFLASEENFENIEDSIANLQTNEEEYDF